jgi:hypothetical protein
MKMSTPFLTIAAAILLVGSVRAQDRVSLPRLERVDEAAKKVKELQKERIATLTELADMTTKLFQSAHVKFDEACEAQLLLLQAQLDAAEKESDRVALYKNFVGMMKDYEKVAQAQVKAGQGLTTAVLKIKARRLEAEIHLEQAKAREAGERK